MSSVSNIILVQSNETSPFFIRMDVKNLSKAIVLFGNKVEILTSKQIFGLFTASWVKDQHKDFYFGTL